MHIDILDTQLCVIGENHGVVVVNDAIRVEVLSILHVYNGKIIANNGLL
jgi:hypothetical protein